MGEYGIRQKVWNRNYGRRVVGMAKENMDGKIGKEHMSGEIGIGDIEGGGGIIRERSCILNCGIARRYF